LRSAYSKITQQVNYVTAPVFIFLIALAEPLFRFLFTEKWLPAVPYFRLLCIAGMIAPYNYYNVNILNARGKATLLFRLEFIKRVVLGCGIFIVYRYGMFALIYLQTSYLFFAFLLNAIFAGKELQLSLWQQVKPMIPILLCALFSGCVVWLLDSLHFIGSDFFRLLVYGSLFLFLFITISLAFKIEAAKESIKLIIAAIKKVRHKWGLQFSV